MVTVMPADITEFFDQDGIAIAYRRTRSSAGRAGLVWLGGFHSDMLGEKLIDRMVETWLVTEFEGGRHARRVGKIGELECGGQ